MALVTPGAVAIASCLTPTTVTVVVTTDFPCSQLDHATISVGTLGGSLETSSPKAWKVSCTDSYVGRLVVVPSGDKKDLVAIKVVGGYGGKRAEDCAPKLGSSPPDYGPGCIVSRRALHFTPHSPLTVDVVLRSSCDGIACAETETCVAGACVPATIPNTGDCADGDGCGEGTLLDGGVRPDATIPTDGGLSDAPDAHVPPTFAPHPIAAPGNVIDPTGLAQQVHVVYAQNDKRFWYFYIDDAPNLIKTRVSVDLVTWTDGDTIDLGSGSNGGNGGNFSVAYARLAGIDVLHLVVSEPAGGTGYTYDIRATLSGAPGAERLTAPVTTSLFVDGGGYQGGCDVDGPSTIVGADGHVYVATGWAFDSNKQTHCDMGVFRSSAADMGGGWSTSFLQSGYFVTNTFTPAHQLVALADSGRVLGAWPDHDDGQNFLALSFTRDVTGYDGGRQSFTSLFDNVTGTASGSDDWALCRSSDSEVHAIRHVFDDKGDAGPNAFEQVLYDGLAWQREPSPPPIATPNLISGFVVVSDPNAAHGMLAFTIGSDGATVNMAKWTPPVGTGQGTWSGWTSFPGAKSRRWIAGSGCGSVRPALFWREGSDPGPYQIVGADVSGFLVP